MRRCRAVVASTSVVVGLAAAACAAAEELSPGAYEVRYELALPHVAYRDEGATTVCLSDVGGSTAFPVLSANNPLSRCPARKIRRDGDVVSFEIACPGQNAAKAKAEFQTGKDWFRGRFAMTMGGKNMTMTETQSGRRLGPCP